MGGPIAIFYEVVLRGGYNFTPHLGAEFVFGENKTVRDHGDWPCTIHQYGGDLLYFFRPDKRLVPFVAAGFGAFNVDFDQSEPFDNRRTAYCNFGGGVKWFLTSWFALRADIRHTITLDNADHLFEGTFGLEFQVGHR